MIGCCVNYRIHLKSVLFLMQEKTTKHPPCHLSFCHCPQLSFCSSSFGVIIILFIIIITTIIVRRSSHFFFPMKRKTSFSKEKSFSFLFPFFLFAWWWIWLSPFKSSSGCLLRWWAKMDDDDGLVKPLFLLKESTINRDVVRYSFGYLVGIVQIFTGTQFLIRKWKWLCNTVYFVAVGESFYFETLSIGY